MSYFKSVAAVFSGPKNIYDIINKCSPWRALLHIFIFLFFASLAVSAAKVWREQDGLQFTLSGLDKMFGKVIIDSSKGILPEKTPEKAQTALLPGNCRLDYLTPDTLDSIKEMNLWTQEKGILWTPGLIMVWARLPERSDEFMAFANSFASGNEGFSGEFFRSRSSNAIISELKQKGFAPQKKTDKAYKDTIDLNSLSSVIGGMVWWLTFLPVFLGTFAVSVFLPLVFAFFMRLFMIPEQKQLFTYRMAFTSVVYSLMPGFAAGYAVWLLPSFFLPLETVFFIVFFFYHIMALRHIKASLFGIGNK